MKIRGQTVGTTMPRTNYEQTNPAMADYLKGKDVLDLRITNAQNTANHAVTAAGNAQTTADNAVTAAGNAQNTANDALPKAGGTMTGPLEVQEPTESNHPATKDYVDNHKVDRAHLANDALYSPIVYAVDAVVPFDSTWFGKTVIAGSSAAGTTTITITQEQSTALFNGFEFAIFWWAGNGVKIAFEGVSVAIAGEGSLNSPTISLPEKYAMVALKKLMSGGNWLVTGNVEVV